MSNVDLVEFIQEKAKCKVMYDVRGKVDLEQMQKWYKELNPEDFTVDMWNDAIWYISKESLPKDFFKNMDDVKAWLIK